VGTRGPGTCASSRTHRARRRARARRDLTPEDLLLELPVVGGAPAGAEGDACRTARCRQRLRGSDRRSRARRRADRRGARARRRPDHALSPDATSGGSDFPQNWHDGGETAPVSSEDAGAPRTRTRPTGGSMVVWNEGERGTPSVTRPASAPTRRRSRSTRSCRSRSLVDLLVNVRGPRPRPRQIGCGRERRHDRRRCRPGGQPHGQRKSAGCKRRCASSGTTTFASSVSS